MTTATTSGANGNGDVIESTAVDVYRQPVATATLFRTEDPVEVIERATKVADALKRVVASRGLIALIKGKEHPRVEAWQTLGSMLGVFPVKEWVRPLPWPTPVPERLRAMQDRGLTFGFEASFRAQRPDGAVIGGGEAACMRTEATWEGRDDFALRSMAQTRATSKALSSPLRFVMALAGYETTPAEEMPTDEPPTASADARRPTAAKPKPSERECNEAQRTMLETRARAGGLSASQFGNVVLAALGKDPGAWEDEDKAARWLKRELDRLPARLVTAVKNGIDAAVAEGGES